jgi:hypothetical protein
LIRGLDVSEPRTAAEKAAGLLTAEVKSVEQVKQLENPDAIVSIDKIYRNTLLGEYANCSHGIKTSDDGRFKIYFWEIPFVYDECKLLYEAPEGRHHFDGRTSILKHHDLISNLSGLPSATITGRESWGKPGVLISRMRDLSSSYYTGEFFKHTGVAITPKSDDHLKTILAFVTSDEFSKSVRLLSQALAIDNGLIKKVPFDLDHWTKIAQEKYSNGLPLPYSDDPTQWLFHGHPCGRVQLSEFSVQQEKTDNCTLNFDNFVLQIAAARLLGYRWPAELDNDMELSDEARAWVKKSEALLPYADEDGIVCIPPVRGEASAEDQLLSLLIAAYGDAWTKHVLSRLLKQVDHAGKTLESWLRDKFFAQHCKLFHHRPFIWHIWDGLRDGFAALVNYHKLNTKLLETLIYTYLGDWISRQKQDIDNGVDGAQGKLAAAEQLKKKLELILEGEAPYDIFVRWKRIEQQPIGWAPDLNDGVHLNIRPYLSVPDVGRKGAGVLRDKPNIKWDKDRGKDVASAPWYHLWGGDRINDHHLTLAEKRAAQEAFQ